MCSFTWWNAFLVIATVFDSFKRKYIQLIKNYLLHILVLLYRLNAHLITVIEIYEYLCFLLFYCFVSYSIFAFLLSANQKCIWMRCLETMKKKNISFKCPWNDVYICNFVVFFFKKKLNLYMTRSNWRWYWGILRKSEWERDFFSFCSFIVCFFVNKNNEKKNCMVFWCFSLNNQCAYS